jgi:hypothetical protein
VKATNGNATNASTPADDAASGGLRMSASYRFNPQVLVLVIAFACAWPAVAGLVVAGVHVVWAATFREVDYTMEEARWNDGAPYITGRLAATGDEYRVAARRAGDRWLVGRRGDETFAAGKTIRLWWSPSAPDIVIGGERTNAVPVAAMPERPGIVSLVAHFAWLAGVAWIGLRVFRWAATRARAGVVTAG